MTPSNQHSDEALWADRPSNAADRETVTISRELYSMLCETYADRGRESKQHTDRETVRDEALKIGNLLGVDLHANPGAWNVLAQHLDAILAAPSLSLAAVRDEVRNVLAAQIDPYIFEPYVSRWPLISENAPIKADKVLYPDGEAVYEADQTVKRQRFEAKIFAEADALADALFTSNILKPSSEVEAAALEAFAETIPDGGMTTQYWDGERVEYRTYERYPNDHTPKALALARAARVRSGKDEA